MLNKKSLLSALLAAVISISSVNAVSLSAFAADDSKVVMTFDGKYDMDDYVDDDFFETENDYDVEKELLEIIAKKAGVKDYYDITYRHLSKITVLDLSGLELVDVPYCINYMTNLTRLDLSSNYLQSDALKKLSLLGCTKLSNINLSDNYLTTMPSWFVSDRVKNGNITKNFVDSSNPRYIIANQTTYYLMDGESVNEDDFKNQILKSIRFNDNKLLPDLLFEYNGQAPYPKDDPDDYPYELDILDWNVPIKDGKVVASQNSTVDVTVKLFKNVDNDNTVVTIKVYLLNGNDLSSYKKRLEGFVKECDSLVKDDYTETSWENFSRALDTAKAILEYSNADMQMLITAYDSLSDMKSKLHLGKKELDTMIKSLITVGGKYKEADYSPSSWAVFSSALETLKTISSDKNATLESAQSAVKKFQSAQTNLKSSLLSVPDKILKADFQKIYGENQNITSSGVTANGTKYTWTINGKELTSISDFTPEVKDTDSSEADILIEAGSASSYRMFATTGKDTFPGKAVLKLDVSDKFTTGTYYLYKWDSSAKRSALSGTVKVVDGIAEIPLSEGGVYYICPKIQNFPLVSSKYTIDDTKKTLVIYPKSVVTVGTLKSNLEYGVYTTVLGKNSNTVSSSSSVKTGMTISAPNMDSYKIILRGELTGDGIFSIDDMKEALALFVSDGITEEQLLSVDFDGNGTFTTNDLMVMLESYAAMS